MGSAIYLRLEGLGRGGRAVQCTGLENRRAQAHVGSNPTPSASYRTTSYGIRPVAGKPAAGLLATLLATAVATRDAALEADKRVAQARAEERRAMAVAVRRVSGT